MTRELSSKNVALDIDGTLVKPSGNDTFIVYLETIRSISCDRAVFQQSGNWNDATGLNHAQICAEYSAFHRSMHYKPAEVMPGAQAAIRLLRREFLLHLVTARSQETSDITSGELHDHFGEVFHSELYEAEGIKADKVAQLQAFVLVDDSIISAMQVAEVATVILFPSPSINGHHLHSRIVQPQAHALINDGMNDDDWEEVWRRSWEEMPTLITDLHNRHYQTQVAVH